MGTRRDSEWCSLGPRWAKLVVKESLEVLKVKAKNIYISERSQKIHDRNSNSAVDQSALQLQEDTIWESCCKLFVWVQTNSRKWLEEVFHWFSLLFHFSQTYRMYAQFALVKRTIPVKFWFFFLNKNVGHLESSAVFPTCKCPECKAISCGTMLKFTEHKAILSFLDYLVAPIWNLQRQILFHDSWVGESFSSLLLIPWSRTNYKATI